MQRSTILTLAGALAVLAVGASVARQDRPGGIGRLWSIVGPADQGPVDFRTLRRRNAPNDALVCPSWLCPAVPDIAAPIYAMDAATLRARLSSLILASPDAMRVAEAGEGHGDRFVVRTHWLRFPDTVDVLVLPQDGGMATLAIYSRSLVGRGDFGVNLARIKRWLGDPVLRDAVRGTASPAQD
jgi:uncharacterized protein (DUF1499 family)